MGKPFRAGVDRRSSLVVRMIAGDVPVEIQVFAPWMRSKV